MLNAVAGQDAAPTPTVESPLRRYLGADLAGRLIDGSARDHDRYAAAAQLASARYALSTYLPRRLLQRQLTGASAQPWLEWVEGSLLFADVSGSTALAERLSTLGREGTEIVTDTLNSYFGTMIEIIQRAGGDLITFGGDALLVLFEGADHTHAATATALSLLRELSEFQRHVPGVGTFPLSMHIGVERGRVALVSAGQPRALRYSAMGHTVNGVAMAEGHGGRGELVLGPQAWSAVAADALGEDVADGYMRVHDLRAAAPVAPPAADEPLAGFDLASLTHLAGQIDRISPYLPPSLVMRILADPQRPVVEADLRPVTVLFAQVLGLGDLVERLPADRAAAVVDAFLLPIQAVVQQYGGFVNKLDLADEGDKLLAVFGAPIAYEDHAERAARAALAMQLQIADCRLQIDALLDPSSGPNLQSTICNLQLRIGLNTGNVFAGNVGTAERKEYTVMGDAVNVAARVMVQAVWGEVRCSAATASLICHALGCDDPHHVMVKGKAEPLELLRLTGEVAIAPDGAVPTAPLIGRSEELAWLRDNLAALDTGVGRVVRVSGDAGIGKSRLAAALLDARPDIRAIQVRCLSFNTNTPYAPWGELLRDLCGIAPADGHDVRAAKLGALMESAGIPADDWLPILAELVRIEVEDTVIVRALDPQQRQSRRFEMINTLLQTAARAEGGLLIVFDNLHWADQVSLDLWQHVAAALPDSPLLLLGLHRSRLDWGGGPQGDGAAELELGDLPADGCAALLSSLAGDAPLSDELRGQIVARAAGNPLFLEELLRALRSSGTGIDALPDSLSGLMLARIDRLDERSRSILRVAAVIGQRFPVGLLQSVHMEDQEALLSQLAHLDAQDLTSMEREIPEQVHLFRHGLMQEVVYQSLLYARRRELHRRIGEYLEQRYRDDLVQVRAEYGDDGKNYLVQIGRNGSVMSRAARSNGTAIFLLAHHYRHSDAVERAVPYLLLSGHIARDDYANEQAIQSYRWALEALSATPNSPRSWEAREALGDVLCTLGRYDEAQLEYAAILNVELSMLNAEPSEHSTFNIQHSTLPPAVSAEVLRSWGDALEKQGRYGEALEKLRQAEATCEAAINAVPPLLLSAISADMGLVLRRLGEYDQALEICQAGLAKIRNDRRSAEDERIEADLQQQIGTIYGMRGQYDQARFHFENALAAQEAIDDLFGCARSHNNLGYLAQLQSDYDRAVAHYEHAEDLAEKVSAKYVLSSVKLNLTYAYYLLDRYDEAAQACHEVLALCTQIGDRDGVAKVYGVLGSIAFNRGDYAAAAAEYRRALGLHRELGGGYEEGNTLALIAGVYNAQGEYYQGRAVAEQAQQIAIRIDVPKLEVEALCALAEADLLASRDAEPDAQVLARAAASAARAAEVAEQIGSRLELGVAMRLGGQIAAARAESADQQFLAAAVIFESIRSAFELARAWARYGEYLAERNPSASAAYLRQAGETFRRIGANAELGRIAAQRTVNEKQE
ncbi:tetratricopeptide repeat protein [Oscillochloris sp. ZM17-4]|uniref:adenylate/guanylate cyclase domain-containing protein n=1 Tax=Oscillochloris sp. ZM17-4 TaxID=2866714 RepID=UPI001C73D163|nr:adenylate/guanylate cyclase domain-containing protein [Oscillochloris sp. ZM17-4]MBX0326113.1 tetratricopeptide repeat protein [Oscillochloris sp. ZM17-4]